MKAVARNIDDKEMAGDSVNIVSVGVWICITIAHFTVASPGFQTNVNGSAVVLHAIASLQQSGVFENDNELLRRIAYVETRDGKLAGDGGIWAVTENKFVQIQNLGSNIQLQEMVIQIQNGFGINWTSVQWSDLRIPLYSAIAARLVLCYLAPHDIPPANDLKAQARFWVQYYNPEGDENEFIRVSSALQGIGESTWMCAGIYIHENYYSLRDGTLPELPRDSWKFRQGSCHPHCMCAFLRLHVQGTGGDIPYFTELFPNSPRTMRVAQRSIHVFSVRSHE